MTAPLNLLGSLAEWGPYALAVAFVGGLLFGGIVRSLALRLWLAFGSITLPPTMAAALYWRGSSATCDGVDCSGTVLAFVYVVGFAIFPICFGIGTLIGSIFAGIRRAIDGWVTPKTSGATPAQ